jgi:mono/diheme cytochrome c family protein
VVFALTAAAAPVEAQDEKGPTGLTAQEYEGWRQYSDKCARCHGQDALPNPVAANLLESLAPSGPMHDEKAFTGVVTSGRTEKGMPAFGKTPARSDQGDLQLPGGESRKADSARQAEATSRQVIPTAVVEFRRRPCPVEPATAT